MGSTEIAGESESVASTSHNITGDFVQSGVSITVSVEAVVGDQLCDPAFSSLLVDGGQLSRVLSKCGVNANSSILPSHMSMPVA